ncbi:MAG: ATP-binding protein [Christensenellales bacterium]
MTKKDILKQIFAELSLERANAQHVAEHNLAILKRDENFKLLEQKERILKMQIGKINFESGNPQKEEAELKQIQDQKVEVLKKYNLTKADLLPKYSCANCKDTGVFDNQICSCVLQKFNNKLMALCNVDLKSVPNLKDYDYKFFDDEKEQVFAKRCVNTLTEYVQKFDDLILKNIVMCGASGTGKTYLTKCLAKDLIAKNKTTLFTSSFDLNNLFLEQHLSNASTQKDYLNELIEVDALIIDDLGTEPMRKNVTKEYLLLLLNERISKGKSTIITTNLSPEQVLDKYQERIFSRIFNKRETLILSFNGKNQRLKK